MCASVGYAHIDSKADLANSCLLVLCRYLRPAGAAVEGEDVGTLVDLELIDPELEPPP
jgi:hypothetical protein